VDPQIPPAAQVLSITGAEEFTRYFASRLNASFNAGKSEGIETLILPSCKTCAGMTGALAEYQRNGWTFKGEYLHLTTVAAFSLSGQDAEVHTSTQQSGGSVVGPSGATVTTAPQQRGDLAFTLKYNKQWRIASIQVLQ
jgi:hypothetical protein